MLTLAKNNEANSRFFENEDMFQKAITMGMKNYASEKLSLLLMEDKGNLKIYLVPYPKVPASILQLHLDLTVISIIYYNRRWLVRMNFTTVCAVNSSDGMKIIVLIQTQIKGFQV